MLATRIRVTKKNKIISRNLFTVMMKYAVLSKGHFRASIEEIMFVHVQLISRHVRKTTKSDY